MNRTVIIGNLTRDPQVRTFTNGDTVCNFTVAVNRPKKQDGTQDADYFGVSAWGKVGDNCQKYLAKGRKVCVIGPVSARAYVRDDGTAAASLEIKANDVEFLSSRQDSESSSEAAASSQKPAQEASDGEGFQAVEVSDLPF